ncbi:protein trachealess-like [Rhagoletis pomonella]|uniref:protein trachealess-like n=1 Tax=Rhagoletis pomonella TaxID=28610 RepID=UPI0017853EAF|nr:protein trachealess-like [Rhagoletis pomonella]
MLPYQAVAMDYAGYQRQPTPGHPGNHMPTMSSLGMPGVAAGPFTHSWLMPSQDLCAMPYGKMPNQHQGGPGMHGAQQPIEPGILELRKEKSRDAARSRRGKENYEFYELAKMLPLPAAITSQLDKASIIRLTISYLKLRDFSGQGDPPWSREQSSSSKLKSAAIRRSPAVDLFEQHQGTHILQSLDGFALAVAADGRFLYISETVSIYLGLSQVEMTGSSIFDYVHQGDHAEIADQLGLSLTNGGIAGGGNGNGTTGLASPTSGASDDGIGTHGTNNPDGKFDKRSSIRHFRVNFNPIQFEFNVTLDEIHSEVVLLLCKLRPQYTFSHTRKSQPPLLGMVALAIALPPPSVHEIRLECDMFVTRINFDLRIAHCEPRVSDLLDYSPEDLVNKSMYSLCHAEDAIRLRKSHMDLIEKGQVLTGYFRLMNKNGGYTWLQTCATVVCSTKNADEQNIICVNYVISNRENENLILDCCQLEPSVDCIKHEELGTDKNSGSPSGDAAPEGQAGVGGDTKSSSPKTDGDGHHQRPRGRSTNSAANTSANSLTLVKDSPNSVNVEMENTASSLPATVATPVSTPNTTTKRKRKSKASMQMEDTPEVSTVSTPVADSQPQSKIAAMEREAPRSRLPSTVEQMSQPQQHVQLSQQQLQQPQQPQQQQQQHSEASVKDLENAMSKHLPSPGVNASEATPAATDFSADALLKQQQQHEKSSTIQWIGTPHYQQPAPMPATALLRQLYANRESVIRATARQTPTGVFYGDQQSGPLPTPPGSESSYDNHQYLQLHPAHPQKSSSDAFTNLVSTYGGYHSSIDYHNAMTPPSSVSPRDTTNNLNATKATSHNSNGYDYSDPLRVQYATPNNAGESGSTPALPLKPQPYSAATATMHHPHSSADPTSITYSNLDQPQYFAPHSSFHLYHKGTPTSGWYSTPS